MKKQEPYRISSILAYHNLYKLPKPTHPLVSVLNYNEFSASEGPGAGSFLYDFYAINLKKNFDGKVKYGQQYYDFDSGIMTFYAPGQVIHIESVSQTLPEGRTLIVHPDFLQGSPLAMRMREYGFFSYATHEALHLSDREEKIIDGIFDNLRSELNSFTDLHTQGVVLAHIELLLNYCDRFYTRQFITRRKVNNDLLVKFEDALLQYFEGPDRPAGLPTVQYFADKLFVSPGYLNDMLKNLTGQTTQQHIQHHIIEKAKSLLTTTSLSVGEIAFMLGFEYPQSFNKLFKNKVMVTPLEFRQSFN